MSLSSAGGLGAITPGQSWQWILTVQDAGALRIPAEEQQQQQHQAHQLDHLLLGWSRPPSLPQRAACAHVSSAGGTS